MFKSYLCLVGSLVLATVLNADPAKATNGEGTASATHDLLLLSVYYHPNNGPERLECQGDFTGGTELDVRGLEISEPPFPEGGTCGILQPALTGTFPAVPEVDLSKLYIKVVPWTVADRTNKLPGFTERGTRVIIRYENYQSLGQSAIFTKGNFERLSGEKQYVEGWYQLTIPLKNQEGYVTFDLKIVTPPFQSDWESEWGAQFRANG